MLSFNLYQRDSRGEIRKEKHSYLDQGLALFTKSPFNFVVGQHEDKDGSASNTDLILEPRHRPPIRLLLPPENPLPTIYYNAPEFQSLGIWKILSKVYKQWCDCARLPDINQISCRHIQCASWFCRIPCGYFLQEMQQLYLTPKPKIIIPPAYTPTCRQRTRKK